MKPGSLRETMPECAAFVDEMRAAFGADTINAAIRGGIAGNPTFYAAENGQEIGTESTARGITLDRIVIGPLYPEGKK